MPVKADKKYLKDLLSIRNIGRLLEAYAISDPALDLLLPKPDVRQDEFAPPGAIGNRLDTIVSNIRGDTFGKLKLAFPPDVAENMAAHDKVTSRIGSIFLREGSLKYRKKASRIFGCQQSHMVLTTIDPLTPFKTSVLPYACNSRCCPICSRLKSEKTYNRAYDVLRNLFERRRVDVRWITLTIRNPPAGELAASILDLLKAWRRLRRPRDMNGKRGEHWNCWTEGVDGYMWNLEVTYNADENTWHPHIHIFFGGDFIPWQKLKAEWKKALSPTGRVGDVKIDDAYVRDMKGKKHSLCEERLPSELLGFLKEICKYTFQAYESDIPADRILEMTEAVFNKRLCGSGGDWQLPPEQERGKEPDWFNEGGLSKVVEEDPAFWKDRDWQKQITTACSVEKSKWLRVVRAYNLYFLLQKAESATPPPDEK